MPTTYAIPNGRTAMDATTYAGAGGTSTITNNDLGTVGFKPDLIWVKSRTDGGSHVFQDSVRGVGSATKLSSNSTNAENNASGDATDPIYGYITAINTNGFSAYAGTTPSQVNKSGQNYVAWQWQAGQGTNTSNTSGSITSSVSANTTAGFSIVTYTGTAIAGTIGHGLGVAPQMIIVKPRSATITTDAWNVYHVSTGNTQFLVLNATDAATTASNRWNNTSPTSSVFSIGTVPSSVGVGYVAYCWTPIAGYSAFGSYTGNGSTDGPFVYLGFRPKFLMVKGTTYASNWNVLDTARDPYNLESAGLRSNSSAAETNTPSGTYAICWDGLSNGFKIRGGSSTNDVNQTSETYIYMAFAENPTKFANAR